jgi:hypothetical protein
MARILTSALGSVDLDAAGEGSITLAPSGEDWLITSTRVSTSNAPGDAEAIVTTYRNGVSPSNEIDATYSGFGDTSDTRIFLGSGETLVVGWSGGQPGARGTVRCQGVAYPAGQGPVAFSGGA